MSEEACSSPRNVSNQAGSRSEYRCHQRGVGLAHEVEELGTLDGVGDAVEREEIGDVAFLESDAAQFEPADLGG